MGKLLETESRTAPARDLGQGGRRAMTVSKTQRLHWGQRKGLGDRQC